MPSPMYIMASKFIFLSLFILLARWTTAEALYLGQLPRPAFGDAEVLLNLQL